MSVLKCSNCGKVLKPIGKFTGNPVWDQYMGNFCRQCNKVYCGDCIKLGGPTPCPNCGSETTVAAVGFVGHLVEQGGGKGNCFIATAVYGSPDAPELYTLREFRDNTLCAIRPGRAFVRLYEHVSPPIARFIETRALLRKIVRTLLVNPLVFLTRGLFVAKGGRTR